jgi:hypothetical protein
MFFGKSNCRLNREWIRAGYSFARSIYLRLALVKFFPDYGGTTTQMQAVSDTSDGRRSGPFLRGVAIDQCLGRFSA